MHLEGTPETPPQKTYRQRVQEYFGRVVNVMQQYVTYVLTQPGQNQTDVSAAVLMLKTLWDANSAPRA